MADQTDRETPTSSSSVLWRQPGKVKRGPKPRFTLENIAEAGIAVADVDGLGGLTIQRVADRLGATKMALYRYIPNRAELDTVILDAALGSPDPNGAAEWRCALTTWARRVHERTLEHPWAVALAQRPHLPGPNELAWYEAGLDSLSELPLSGAEKLDVLALLSGHAMSVVGQESHATDPEANLAASVASVLASHAGTYPRTVEAFDSAADTGERDRALHFGIERILAGVAALVSERERPTR